MRPEARPTTFNRDGQDGQDSRPASIVRLGHPVYPANPCLWRVSAICLAALPAVVAVGAFTAEAAPPRRIVPDQGRTPARKASEAGEADKEVVEVEEFTDDLIILKSGEGIEGKVIRQTADAVKVEVPAGTFWVSREAIDRIEFNLASRLAELAEDDYAGRYELALKALEMGEAEQARRILEDLVGKPGVPPDIYKRLAGMCEAEGELKKALDYWKRFQMSHRDDAELGARIAELEKKVVSSGGAAAGKASAVAEGLEAGKGWSAINWGNPATVGVESLDGNKVLVVEVQAGGGKDKAAIGRSVRLDLSEKKKFTFSVFNAEKRPVQIALAIITSTFYESRPVRARPDWNMDLSFDLRDKKFKCQDTNWRFTTDIGDPSKIRQVIFLIYSGKRKALLYFDNIRAE